MGQEWEAVLINAIIWLKKNWQGALVLSLVVSAGLYVAGLHVAVWHYKSAANDARRELATLQVQVEQQNETSALRIAQLTHERDRIQSALNAQAQTQEKIDEQAKAEIARLSDELRSRPVRVRIQSCISGDAGHRDRGAQDTAAADPEDSAGDTGPAYGILPTENHRRLASAIDEIETMGAAYASCRAALESRDLAGA